MMVNRWFGVTLAGLMATATAGIAQAAMPHSGTSYSALEHARQERAEQYHFKKPGDLGYIQRRVWDGGVLPKAALAQNPGVSSVHPIEFSAFEARSERAKKYHFKEPGDLGYIQRNVWD